MGFHRRGFTAALLVALASGCAGMPPDKGRSDVVALAKERGWDAGAAGDVRAAKEMFANFAGRPLSAADAVRMTLVNSPQLRAIYAELGVGAADVYEAGRLSNPTLSASVLFSSEPGASSQVGLGLVQNFTDLLLLSRRSRLAQTEFERIKQTVAAKVLALAADSEASYYNAVGAAQLVTLREATAKAAQASATLAQRFFDAGNITRLQLSQEQAAAAQAELDRIEAAAAVADARAELNGIMGLSDSDQRWLLAPRLPALMSEEDSLADLLRLADTRPDLRAARGNVEALADMLGLTRSFRYLGDLELGIETERETDGARLTGPTLGWELPIFNQGEGRATRAAAELERAEAELKSLEVEISNEIRRASLRVASDKARVEQYRVSLIPLREAVVARTQERVNFMLVGQFDLLLAKQQEYQAYEGYLDAVRDYWIARTDLARVIGAQLPTSRSAGSQMLDAEQLIRPKDAGMQMRHGGEAEGMQMPMDHSDHGTKSDAPAAGKSPMAPAPKSDPHAGHGKPAAPPAPKGKKSNREGHDMPTGMESHAPLPANSGDEAETPQTQDHGDHQ